MMITVAGSTPSVSRARQPSRSGCVERVTIVRPSAVYHELSGAGSKFRRRDSSAMCSQIEGTHGGPSDAGRSEETDGVRYRRPDTPRWGRTSFRDQETSLCSQSARGPGALERPVNRLCLSKCGELWSCAKIPRYSWTHRAPPQPPTASADRSIAVDSWDAGRPYGLETDNRCASCRTQLSIFQAPLGKTGCSRDHRHRVRQCRPLTLNGPSAECRVASIKATTLWPSRPIRSPRRRARAVPAAR